MNAMLSRREMLKASAIGAIGTFCHVVAPSALLAHDNHFHRPLLNFTLDDVRFRNDNSASNRTFLFYHPRPGRITTQNERRAMVEVRMNVGVWRSIREVKRLAAASSSSQRDEIQANIDKATNAAHKAVG